MRIRAGLLLLLCCVTARMNAAPAPDALPQEFLVHFDLPSAAREAEARLRRNPRDVEALFVRMEVAELQERPQALLDSALRLCALPAGSGLQELASNRILQHAGNTRAFTAAVRRVRAASTLNNACAFNLKLALVAAAADGQPALDLDQSAHSAGLLTHWLVAGPFGRYDNVDFERRWPAELDQLSRRRYAGDAAPENPANGLAKKASAETPRTVSTERFWFRDGMLSLPEYLSASGVFYAVSEAQVYGPRASVVEVLSSGSYRVFVDGKEALSQDARYAAAPARGSAVLQLKPGRHRILLKFTADTTPLSLALHPQSAREEKTFAPSPAMAPALAPGIKRYVEEMLTYFRGDFIALERLLHQDSDRNPGEAAYLHALLYSAAEERSPRADAAWKALAQAQPSALLARLKSQESALARGQTSEARQEAARVLAERPGSDAALQLAFTLARSPAEAPAAPTDGLTAENLMARLLDLHPSCARLAEAVKVYGAAAEQDRARQLEQRLAACAPESLQYARTLSDAGRHGAAAAWLQQWIVSNPLHRAARRLLIEQLVLSGQQSAARLQARQLHALAPNAFGYAHLAHDPESVQDASSARASGFTQDRAFYVPYRRDSMELVRQSAQRSFSGGPLVIVLSDKVINVGPAGDLSVYVHRILRLLNKDGISRYGEIALPRGADLLELRTIKPSGEVIEPELGQQKPSISMPALEPGDVMEEEYVVHYAELGLAPESAAEMTFGSFDAPILFSRLVLLAPPEINLSVQEQAGAPQPLIGQNDGSVVRIWERNDSAQTVAEAFLPAATLLPTVTIAAAGNTRSRLRDQLIDAAHAGLRVSETAAQLDLARVPGEMERARRLYRFVTAKIDSTGPDWAINPAEETLLNGQGSRTSALLALARTSGLKAGLVLARKIDRSCAAPRDLSCYTEPLVRFWFPGGEILDADAEADDLPFGAFSPTLEKRDALFIPWTPEDEKRPEITALTARFSSEKSVAEGDLALRDGDLTADLQIRLGAARAQEVRGLLRNPGERQPFFEQLAIRIFPGAVSITGSSAHEDDPEQPLEISLHCTVPQFLTRQSGVLDVDQLVPALGLRAKYAKTPARKFPLYLETLFFESAAFHLHLPENVQASSLPGDFSEKSEFGEYSVRFTRSARRLDVRRDFRVPVQMIAPEKYAAFAQFARHVDDAERQRISLEIRKDVAGERQYRVPPATGMLR